MNTLSWEPKRRGREYCAPACGGGCTYIDYLKRKKEAKEVLALLKDKTGWEIRIHENLGWWVYLKKAGMTLHWTHYDGFRTYTTMLSEKKNGDGGSYNWQAEGTFKDPNKAITAQLRAARAYVRQCLEVIEDVA